MSLPPLDDLLALLPDNTTGQIEPVDLRFITESLYNGVLGNQENQELYLLIDGSRDLVSQYTPVNPQSVATKKYVDDNLIPDQYVQRSGDTMTGALFLPPQFPTQSNQAVTKAYADSVVDEYMPLAGGSFTGNVNSNGQPPTNGRSLVDRDWVLDEITQAGGGDVSTSASNFYALATEQSFYDVVVRNRMIELPETKFASSYGVVELETGQVETETFGVEYSAVTGYTKYLVEFDFKLEEIDILLSPSNDTCSFRVLVEYATPRTQDAVYNFSVYDSLKATGAASTVNLVDQGVIENSFQNQLAYEKDWIGGSSLAKTFENERLRGYVIIECLPADVFDLKVGTFTNINTTSGTERATFTNRTVQAKLIPLER